MLRFTVYALLFVVFAPMFLFSASLVLLLLVDAVTDCELNPWSGYTCHRAFAPLVFLAIPGVFTIIPTALILLILIGVRISRRLKDRA